MIFLLCTGYQQQIEEKWEIWAGGKRSETKGNYPFHVIVVGSPIIQITVTP